MHVFYEEGGTFKVGSVLADQNTSLQIEAPHGKRSKIKAASVLLSFERPSPLEFMAQAQKIADELDSDFLWECSEQGEFDYHVLAREYFGRAPEAVEAAGLLIRLHQAPMHFYKRGHGCYKPAPADALAAAKASVERKRREAEQQGRYVSQLLERKLPHEFAPQLLRLLYAPEKSSLEWKALEAASKETRLSAPRLLEQCGALASPHEYHFNRFLFEHFSEGTGFPDIPPPALPEHLPEAVVRAFSIDDATTTEIDDAFSVTVLENGNFQIGVHIAAPALGIAPGSEVDSIAAKRLSTVYTPARKITMLPDPVIERFSLREGHTPPAVSMYLEVRAEGYEVISSETRVERVPIAANLRHDALEAAFNEQALTTGSIAHRFGEELEVLWQFARQLEARRAKEGVERGARVDYSFYVDAGRVTIRERRRGSPIDKVVSELMIHVNTEWGRKFAELEVPAIYRSQANGKVCMSTSPLPHQGLNVAQYVWASSPLRRFVDLMNQRQIAALAKGDTPPYSQGSEAMYVALRDFDLAHEAYSEFQRTMERYWSLAWLLQENVNTAAGAVLKENLVKLDAVPLITRVPSLPPLAPGARVELQVDQVDLIELTLSCAFKQRLAEPDRRIEEEAV
jgi:exoribonuclease II